MKTPSSLAIALLAFLVLLATGCQSDCGSTPQAPRPTNRVAVKVSAVEGGEVEFGSGGKLTFPPGALDEDTEITVDIAEPDDTFANSVVKGKVFTFGPAGLEFNDPVILTLDPSSDPFEGPGSIARFNPNLGLWDEQGPTGSEYNPNLGLWDQAGDSGEDYNPNLGLWDKGHPEQMLTGLRGFSSWATTLPNHGVYSCGIDGDGGACCWGLQVTDCTDCAPAPEPIPTTKDFVQVSAGAWSDCGVKRDGTIECWGANPPIPPATGSFVDVSTGRGHACGLKDDGTVTCFMAADLDYDVPSPSETNVVDVTSGDYHSCARQATGEVFCWGPDREGEASSPSGANFAQIDAGAKHTCAVRNDGTLQCWGSELSGIDRVPVRTDTEFVQVSVGVFAACALTDVGGVICWGADFDVVTGTPSGAGYTQVIARHRHACAARADGSFECWGQDIEGSLAPPTGCGLPLQTLECEPGFVAAEAGCMDIDECANAMDSCGTNATCSNTPGSFECACEAGFTGDGTTCTDVDECTDGTDNCAANATCTNSAGGFDCACDPGYTGDGVACADEDECAAGTDNCAANATCTNNAGGFDCACDPGFTGDGVTCTDEDECAAGTDNCGVDATCTNVPGSFDCACDPGYVGDGFTCADEDECANGTDNCDANATCTNNTGSFACMCNPGFTGDGLTCLDDDECVAGTDDCGVNATCTNTPGSFTCMCDAGYSGDGLVCSDDDECVAGTDNCDPNATCSNTIGSFTCACTAGYSGDGITCLDDDECVLGTDNCDLNATCANTPGSFTCTCNAGFTGDGTTCTPLPIDGVSSGAQHNCALRSGEVWCWGDNFYGQLGDGSTLSRPTAVRVGSATNWAELASGAHHNCAINANGELWCWGSNISGALGDGTASDALVPVRESTNATNWVKVTAGVAHTCALTTANEIYCWGDNFAGQLGNGVTGTQEFNPTLESTNNTTWASVVAGGDHTCALDGVGDLWCWGANFAGQLGDGMMGIDNPDPTIVGGGPWDAAALGGAHTCATRSGELHCWGANLGGQLGVGDTSDRAVPTRVGVATDWATPAAGADNSCAVKSDLSLWCWGSNLDGQVGVGDTTDRTSPARVGAANDWTAVEIPVVGAHACGIQGGTLVCWGSNFAGQLGFPSSRLAPAGPLAPGSTWSSVSAIGGEDVPFALGLSSYACGIREGAPWCWGGVAYTGAQNDTAAAVAGTTGNTNWTTVSSSSTHSCGLQSGAPRCWGDNADGGLGDGSNSASTTPVVVMGTIADADWTVASAGSGFSCGIKSGSLWCWGRGLEGQLGDGLSSSQTVPIESGASTGTAWTTVSAAHTHACGIHAGSLFCWGGNAFGQLGNGTTNPATSIPAVPAVMGTFTAVAAGEEHTCAIDVSGALWCAGDNTYGELGDGTTSSSLGFISVGAAQAPWSDVAVGRDNSCGVASGSVYCWGVNDSGQLGDGTTTTALIPAAVSTSFSDWVEVTVGDVFTCGRRSGGEVHCWGDNSLGQMGDGSVRALTPRLVAP